MTLPEFLLARFAEDETVARDALAADIGTVAHEHMARWDPARVLAECEAKRLIVADLIDATGPDRWPLSGAVRYLASIYADHPDYRDEWKP